MSPQSGVPYEKRQPSPELRSFLDPLKPGAYFDCGRARLYGIDEVLEREAERRGRPVGPDHFQLVATDGGLIFCRASITFAIAARWKDVTISRPVDRPRDERVDLAVVWPNHGELTFTVSRRLASNVFRRWLQFQAQSTRRHQVEQAARYEQSQRGQSEPESKPGGLGRNLAASSMPAPETLQMDEAEREVLRMAVQSGEVSSSPASVDHRPEVAAGRSRPDMEVARVVPVGDMAVTTHFDDRAAESPPGAQGPVVSKEVESSSVDPVDDVSTTDGVRRPGDDWRNGWTYSDDQQYGNGGSHSADQEQAVHQVAPGQVQRPVDDADRMRRATADTRVFPDAMRLDSESGHDGADVGQQSRRTVINGSRSVLDPSARVLLGDLAEDYTADPDPEPLQTADDRDDANRSRGGYLDGLPATAGDAALASSGAPDRRTRPDSPLDLSSRSVSTSRDVGLARRAPVPQIAGARLQTAESLRRRNPDGLDIRSAVLTDAERSLWADIWHRHRISIMATVSLVALLVIAVSSLLARNGDDAASGTTVDADIVIPTRQDPVATDPATATNGEATGVTTRLSRSDTDGSDVEPNSPMIVDTVPGEADGGDADTAGQAGSDETGTDQTTVTNTVRICHSNYGGCVPVAPDVDCEGDGDGPAFLSEPVVIFGEDVYDLDTDGDREACEPGQPPADEADN